MKEGVRGRVFSDGSSGGSVQGEGRGSVREGLSECDGLSEGRGV